MKTKSLGISFRATLGALALALIGCERQSRGNADASGSSRAAAPEEGGATSTKSDAGKAKNFGDTEAKQASDGGTISTAGATGGPDARDPKAGTEQPSTKPSGISR